MEKEANVILLLSENITTIGKPIGKLEYNKDGFDPHIVQTFEMYIATDDEIKEGDYFLLIKPNKTSRILKCTSVNGNGIWFDDSKLEAHSKFCSKIIATTDESLLIELKTPYGRIHHQDNNYTGIIHQKQGKHYINLPQPSKAFIEKYCKLGGIDEVMVEYEPVYLSILKEKILGYKLKINSRNEITIHPIKDSYTIEELKELCKQYPNDYDLGAELRKIL